MSHLQHLWSSGGFALLAQLPPLLTTEAAAIAQQVADQAQGLDAVLTVEAPAGAVAVSSFAMAVLFKRLGIESVVHLSGRDRNRLALQSDLLGLGALGIPNLLIEMQPITRAALTQNTDTRLVHDLDGPALLATALKMRDEARFTSSASIKSPPMLYIGARCSLESGHLQSACERAQFVVTPPIQDTRRFAAALRAFQAAHPAFLSTRPLVVSLPLAAEIPEQRQASRDEGPETRLQQLIAAVEELQTLDGIRGFNLVIPNQSDLPSLEQIISTARAALPTRAASPVKE